MISAAAAVVTAGMAATLRAVAPAAVTVATATKVAVLASERLVRNLRTVAANQLHLHKAPAFIIPNVL